MSFYEKFFGYYLQKDGQYKPYSDHLAGGAFADWRHFAWICLAPIITFATYRHFRNKPKYTRKIVVILSTFLLVSRIIFQVVKVTYGDETPFLRIIPFHQCAVMGVLLPIVALFNLEKLKTPVYVISMMGGFASIAFGEYFTSSFVTFYSIEGIISHSLLILIPIIEIASGNFSLVFRQSWTVLVGMILLIIRATFANEVLFRDRKTNYMFLKESGFPGGFGGRYYFGIYIVIFLLVFAAIYLPPEIYRRKKLVNE